jgi:hypothetical protein
VLPTSYQDEWSLLPTSKDCNDLNQSPIDITQARLNFNLDQPVFEALKGGCKVEKNLEK